VSTVVDSKIVALGALALGASQLNQQGSSQKQKTTPAMSGGGGGGAAFFGQPAGRPMGPGTGEPQTKITLEAPNPEINTNVSPGPTNVGGATSGGGSSSSGSKSKSDRKSKKSSSSSVSASDYDVPDVDMGQDDSGDGNPQTDIGAAAADTPGIQSSKPSDVTRELNQEQGYSRTIHDAERDQPANIDLGNGGKKKSSKNKKAAGSGGGFIDNAVDAGSDFFNDTIGWGDI